MYVSPFVIASLIYSLVFPFASVYLSGANAHGPKPNVENLRRTDRIYSIRRTSLVIYEAERLFTYVFDTALANRLTFYSMPPEYWAFLSGIVMFALQMKYQALALSFASATHGQSFLGYS